MSSSRRTTEAEKRLLAGIKANRVSAKDLREAFKVELAASCGLSLNVVDAGKYAGELYDCWFSVDETRENLEVFRKAGLLAVAAYYDERFIVEKL